MSKLALVVSGPPGCGKGTIIKKIEQKGFDFLLFPMSPIMSALKDDPVCGHEVREAMTSGNLVPDHIAIPAFLRQWNKISDHGSRHIVLDGVVRNEDQAQEVSWVLRLSKIYRVLPIVVDVPLDECCRRMIQRKREDDTLPVIKRRCEVYAKTTIPAIERFSSMFVGRTITLNNDRDPDISANELKSVLDELVEATLEGDTSPEEVKRLQDSARKLGFTG